MKLQEISSLIFDDVCLYKKSADNDYEDLWRGNAQNIPREFLEYTVGIVGAKRKGIIDIELRGI